VAQVDEGGEEAREEGWEEGREEGKNVRSPYDFSMFIG